MQKKKTNAMIILGLTAGMMAATGCTSVKQYQKNKLNDGEMELAARKVEKGENSFQTYKEGSSGANGGKVGGGCGCN